MLRQGNDGQQPGDKDQQDKSNDAPPKRQKRRTKRVVVDDDNFGSPDDHPPAKAAAGNANLMGQDVDITPVAGAEVGHRGNIQDDGLQAHAADAPAADAPAVGEHIPLLMGVHINNPAAALFGPPRTYGSVMRWIYHNELFGLYGYLKINRRRSDAYHAILNGVQDFTWGFKFALLKAWPAALALMTAKDVISYLTANEHFGDAAHDIFAGTATGKDIWSSHFGSDDYNNNLLVIVGMLLAPVILGMGAAIGCALKPSENRELEETILRNVNADFDLLTEQVGNNDEPAGALQALVDKGALSSLVRIADVYHENQVDRSNVLHGIKDDMWKSRFRALQAIANSRSKWRDFLLWTLGEHNEKASNIFYVPVALLALLIGYADARYLELLINKILQVRKYQEEKDKCEREQHNVYTFMPQSQRVECTPCGDWPMVSYQEAKTAQGCIDGLLRAPTEPKQISERLSDLRVRRDDVKRIDFTAQPWTTWSDEEFADVLDAMQAIVPPKLTEIIFSAPNKQMPQPSAHKVARLAQFLRQVECKRLEMANLNMGANNTALLMNGVRNNTSVETFNFSGNDAGDVGITEVAQTILTWPKLNAINLAQNSKLNNSVPILAQTIATHPRLDKVNLAANGIQDSQIPVLMDGVVAGNTVALDISDTVFSSGTTDLIAQKLLGSSVRELELRNCQFAEDQLITLTPVFKQLTGLNLASNNMFRPQVMVALFNELQTSSMRDLDISGCGLGDVTANALSALLKKGTVNRIVISGNLYTSAGFETIAKSFPDSNVQIVIVDDMPITGAASIIADLYQNATVVPVNHWRLRGMRVPSEDAKQLLSSLKNVSSIDLGNNLLDGSVAPELTQFVGENKNLKVLILDQTQVNGSVTLALGTVLKDSALETIVLSHTNAMRGDGVGGSFAQMTIAQPKGYKIGGLQRPTMSRDEARALADAKPISEVRLVNLADAAVTDEAALALCRSQIASNIQFNLADNSGITNLRLKNCLPSSSSRLAPPKFFEYMARGYDSLMKLFRYQPQNHNIHQQARPQTTHRLVRQATQQVVPQLPRPSNVPVATSMRSQRMGHERHVGMIAAHANTNETLTRMSSTTMNLLLVGGVGVIIFAYILLQRQSAAKTKQHLADFSFPDIGLPRSERRRLAKANRDHGVGLFQSASRRVHELRQNQANTHHHDSSRHHGKGLKR